MSVERIDIQIRSDGSRLVKRDLTDIARNADSATRSLYLLERSLRTLKYAVSLLAGALFLRELKEYSDQWIAYENNIRLSTRGTEEAIVVQEELFRAAQAVRVEMGVVVQLYRRTAQAANELGASQRDLIDLTKGVGMALAIQGISTDQARGALLQLGQLLGMARIRAQEFNSINENAPRILQAVANNVDAAGGSIHKLRIMVLKGTLSNKQFFDAFMKEMPKLQAEFATVRPTISQAFTVLDNAIGKYVGDANKATGASTMFAQGVMWVANNIDLLAKSIAVVAATMVVAFGPQLLALLARARLAVASFTAAMAANPILLIATILTTAITALYVFRNEITLSSDGLVTLGDYLSAIWDRIKTGLSIIWTIWKTVWNTMLTYAQSNFVKIGDVLSTVLNWFKAWGNSVIGIFYFIVRSGGSTFKQLPLLVGRGFELVLNTLAEFGTGILNTFIDAYNAIASYLGSDQLTRLTAPQLSSFEGAFSAWASSTAEIAGTAFGTDFIGEALNALGQGVGTFFDELDTLARKYSEERRKATAANSDLTLKPPGGGYQGENDTTKLEKSLRRLLDTLDPIQAGVRAAADATFLLGQAQKAGLITADQYVRYLELVKDHYQDQIDPMGAVIRSLDEETRFMGLNHDERRAGLMVMETEKKLRRDGYVLNEIEKKQLYDLYVLNLQNKRIADEKERIYRKLIAPQRELAQGQAALNQLLREGVITLSQYRQELAELRLTAGQGDWTDGFITQLGVLSAEMQNFTARTGALFGDLTNTMIDGFADATARAIVMGESFSEVMGNAARQALVQLISGLIKLGIQMVLTKTLGDSLAAASVATTTATAGAAATAWAPAAALASLATLGTNSTAANAALLGTTALAQSIAVGSLAGLQSGGYTGDLPTTSVAGLVHGQEFVVNASATKANRSVLESMNRGQAIPTAFNVNIENYTDASIKAERIDANTVRIIARNEAEQVTNEKVPNIVASDLSNPNGRISKSLSRHTTAQRKL